jgi:hypothetical protein
MTFSFVPGEPSKQPQAVAQAQWRTHLVTAYCSGNNLIVLSDDMKNLQTIYLDCDAQAVDVDPYSGAIAVAVGCQVMVYEPMNEFMKQPRWQFCCRMTRDDDHSQVNSLSWGLEGEIVTGSDSLTLWSVKKEFGEVRVSVLWSKKQAAPVYLAQISQDSTLIASCGKYDRLLKVWNRVSFAENSLFDMTLLMHPQSITEIRWKKFDPQNLPKPDTFTNTLYTLSRDATLRIWSSHEYENSHIIQHWGSIDLYDGSPDRKGKRFVWTLDQHLVESVIHIAIKNGERIPCQDIINHDMAFIINEDGCCTAYPMRQLSQNPPKLLDLDTKHKRHIRLRSPSMIKAPEFVHFAEPLLTSQGEISLLIHDLNGIIRHVKTDLRFLWTDDLEETGYLSHKLSGHLKSIQRIIKTGNGEAMLTCSRFEENAIWVPQQLKDNTTLNKKSSVKTPNPISQAIVFDDGNQLLTICGSELILWDTTNKVAKESYRFGISADSEPECFSIIPIEPHDYDKHFVVAIYKHQTKAWLVTRDKISSFDIQNLPVNHEDIHLIAPTDPVSPIRITGKEILSVIDKKGQLRRFYAKIENDEIRWTEAPVMFSNISNASYIRGSTVDKFAIVDESKKKLTIWDLNRNVLEYEEVFDDPVRDIDWTSTKNKQSILAVGFDHYSLLYTQLRYDYTNKTPPFLAIKKIDIQSYTTHIIGDSVWLKDGTLAIGSGNQIFVADKNLNMQDKFTKKSIGSRNIVSNDIITLCSVLNGTLPVYHPQLLIQCLFNEKFYLVREVLLRLFLKIRELELSGGSVDQLGSTLGLDISKFFAKTWVKSDEFEEPFTEFNSHVAELLKEKLMNHPLPYLTRHQQITLMSAIETVVDINDKIATVDDNGLRFFLGMKLFQLHKGTQEKLTMRDINWALHSENKELLLQLIESSVKDGKILWPIAKDYRLAYWLRYEDLIRTFESIARNEFTSGQARDPSKCAIFYLSLKKKQILYGLWRTASGHLEQSKMMNFLKNDFREERWRKAALKNAFVLLSKHRYMDAACFFLLGSSLKDAVNVLIKQVNDVQLAIAVCRVSEGDDGQVLKELLTKYLLSDAVSNGDRWTTSYIYWKLREQSRSIQALVRSPIDILTEEEKTNIVLNERSRSFIEDDPLLIVLYKNLREKNVNYFEGSLQITPQQETEFIARVACIYTRMGCDYLSVDLVKNWTFVKVQDFKKIDSTVNLQRAADQGTESMLEKYGLSAAARRRTSILTGFSTSDTNGGGSGLSILEKYGLASDSIKRKEESEGDGPKHNNYTPPPQAAFQEPDMSSFNFGF